MLAKLSDLKARAGVSSTAEDALLTLLLNGAAAAVERYCDREIQYSTSSLTEYFDGGGPLVRPRRWPITSVTSVKEAIDFAWASATALVADEEYRVLGGLGGRNRGHVLRQPESTNWLGGRDCVQVVYKGGYNDPAVAPVDGVDYVPAHIQEAVLLQAAHLWQRRGQLGGGAISVGAMGQTTVQESVRLLPAVMELLRGERRSV